MNAAFQASPGNTVAELVKRYRSLKKEYLSRQREKAVSVLAANKVRRGIVGHRMGVREGVVGREGNATALGSGSSLSCRCPPTAAPRVSTRSRPPFIPLLPDLHSRLRFPLPWLQASLDQFVAHRLASVGVGVGVGSASALPAAAPSLPIPKLGDVNTGGGRGGG